MAERKSKTTEVTAQENAKVAPVTIEDPAPAASPAASPAPVAASPKSASPSVAAPLDAPVEKPVRTERIRAGQPNAIAPHAVAKDNSIKLTVEGGDEVSVEDIFDYPTMQNPGALVRVNRRVYREYTHQGAVTKTTQLMYPQGAMISIFEAQRVKAEMQAIAEANASQ